MREAEYQKVVEEMHDIMMVWEFNKGTSRQTFLKLKRVFEKVKK